MAPPAAKSIAVVAPGRAITTETSARVAAVAEALPGGDAPELVFHPQCFLSHGHFAGDEAARENAFVDVANDPAFEAVWFARGGYGACRFSDAAFARLGPAARDKVYLGYSDAGALLGRLYRERIGIVAHGPMPADIMRAGGEAAVARALGWLVRHDAGAIEASPRPSAPVVAFNATVLSHIVGTGFCPDLSGHVVMLEDTGEYLYRLDRAFFTIASSKWGRRAAGFMLGRISDIPENDIDFGADETGALQFWCGRAGVPYLGRADIGHDVDNKIVVFG